MCSGPQNWCDLNNLFQPNYLDAAVDNPPFQIKIKQSDAVDPVRFIHDITAISGSGVIFKNLGDDGSKVGDLFFQKAALVEGFV